MDWGLILVALAIVFLVGHLALDFRVLLRNMQILQHDDAAHTVTLRAGECDRCHTLGRGEQELRHEAIWTVAAVVVLAIHITLDFVA